MSDRQWHGVNFAMPVKTNLNLFISAIFALVLFMSSAASAQEPIKPTPAKPAAFDVIGISVRTNNSAEATGNGEIPKLWQRLFMQGILGAIPGRADDGIVAVYTDYASDADGDYTYILGAKVKTGTKPPNEMIAVTIPAGKYMQFVTAKGPGAEVVPPAWQQIYSYFQDPAHPRRAFQSDYEVYADISDPKTLQAHIFVGVK